MPLWVPDSEQGKVQREGHEPFHNAPILIISHPIERRKKMVNRAFSLRVYLKTRFELFHILRRLIQTRSAFLPLNWIHWGYS